VYRNGTIGGELLSRFKVIFDYFNKKIYLKKNAASYKKEFGYNMSGLTVAADGEDLDIYRITMVKEGSPAEKADLRENDIIESVNGISNEKLKLSDLYKIFNYKDGKKIRMYVRRDGDLVYKTFKLEDILKRN
jgi:C-terminal processing protease CtpA/Prc